MHLLFQMHRIAVVVDLYFWSVMELSQAYLSAFLIPVLHFVVICELLEFNADVGILLYLQ